MINQTNTTSVTQWVKFVNHYTNLFNLLLSQSITTKPQSLTDLETIINANKKIKNSDQIRYRSLATFRTKLITNQIPTRLKLHKRYPNLYDSNLCPRCHIHIETLLHIFNCHHAFNYINKKKDKLRSIITDQFTKDLNPKNNPIPNFNLSNNTIFNLATGNFHSPFDQIKKRSDISNKSLKILYKVWKQRSETASTSPSSGIKWKKTKAAQDNSLSKNKNSTFQKVLNTLEINNNYTNKKIFTSTIVSSF
jgi:hypothetical protein